MKFILQIHEIRTQEELETDGEQLGPTIVTLEGMAHHWELQHLLAAETCTLGRPHLLVEAEKLQSRLLVEEENWASSQNSGFTITNDTI